MVELMIVVLIIGIIAAIAIPNYLSSEGRAREAGLKSNMHAFQLAAEDYRVRGDSTYAGDAAEIVPLITGTFKNPFDKSVGVGLSWEDRESMAADPTPRPGITSYSDSGGLTYNLKGYGKSETLPLVLTTGR
jgi:Tfp pilus assembly protein PilE